MTNVFEQGLLGTGATLAARLLSITIQNVWLVNVVQFGQPVQYRYLPASRIWVGPEGSSGDGSKPFPYGNEVSPP